ncbi:uncharacterized protein LOC122277108 [Carya illinoinensis]|uniref:uncharacterized protein LOC122277108 n=1 Tax=Carya illinoinensis TaxID=32201 RepID=UPI001C71B3DB|nr:uncharacterized protein LOC122277108 [Carya illinoinensis]
MNDRLLKNFSIAEVEEALRQMVPLKSLGPDGFGACFYQSHWNQVADEVCVAVLSTLNGNSWLPKLNYTFIALIPKLKEPKHTRKRGKEGSVAVELDMSKAYDHIEWLFLEAVMKKLGFCEKLIALIMSGVSTRRKGEFSGGSEKGWLSPNSLASAVYREKYSKQSSLLEGKLGSKPSLIWKSICNARDLIKEGMGWRVGDGKKILIWGHKWLNTPTSFSVQSLVSVLRADTTVDELTGENKGERNEERIQAIFHDEEMDKIRRSRGKSLMEKQVDHIWKKIWELEVPNMVKAFLWKAANELLATKKKLYQKKIVKDPICPICHREEELVMHKWRRAEGDFMALWEKLMDGFDREKLEVVAIQMRNVWLRRNTFVFENRLSCPKRLLLSAIEVLEEYKQANRRKNADIKRGKMGMGVIMRDVNGEALLAACDKKFNVQLAEVAECYALWKALKVCSDLNVQKVIFEGNAKGVIAAVQSEEENLSIIGPLVDDIRDVLSDRKEWSLQFDYREMNKVAHNLGKICFKFR